MRHWLTTHHPHRHPDDDAGWNVYVRARPSPQPEPADRVFFYETQHGPRGIGKGRRGIVRIATVAGPSQSGDVDGWPLMYPCTGHRRLDAVVPSEDVLAALGRGSIRIRGGLMELTPEQQDRLAAMVR